MPKDKAQMPNDIQLSKIFPLLIHSGFELWYFGIPMNLTTK